MYHFVIEGRPKDFMPIDINILLNNKIPKDYTTLMEIDKFTKSYTVDEIFDMIEEANIVPDMYLDGKLEIINDNKYRFGIITKNDDFALDKFLKDNINNKQIMNKFYNVYLKYNALYANEMKMSIQKEDIHDVLNILFSNSYDVVRCIYIFVYERIVLNIK